MISLIIALFLIAFLFQVDFIFYIGYICIVIYAWSRWMVPKQLADLGIERRYAQRAFWGEEVGIDVKVTNNSRFPMPWLMLSESIAVQLRGNESLNLATTLNGKETAVYHYTVKAKRRGYYQIGPLRLGTSDLFGLTPEQVGYVQASTLTVYPQIISLSQLGLPSRLPFGTIAGKQRLFEDPARPMGVRNFRSGDSIRQINWKTSAHTRQLMVKTFQPAISLETAVVLDLHTDTYARKNRYSTVEWAITVAASLAAHLVEQRQSVGLLTNGFDPLAYVGQDETLTFDEDSGRLLAQDREKLQETPSQLIPPAIKPGNGRSHLMKILERLARLESENSIPLNSWATTACSGLSWGVTILAITPKGDFETCQMMHRLLRNGYNPILIVIEPDHQFSEVRERARRLGFQAFLAAREKDLEIWQRPMSRQ